MTGGGETASPPPFVLLDACCLINLYATRRMCEIVADLPVRFAVAERARTEAGYVRRGGRGEDSEDREPVDVGPLIVKGLLAVWRPETEAEAAIYVSFAVDLDDGEAMACALALHRGAGVATDDRKAQRLLRERAPDVELTTTAAIIKRWAELRQLAATELARVLIDVQERGRFAPGRHDPLRPWWSASARLAADPRGRL